MTDIALTPAAPDEDCPPQVPPISTALGQEVAATLAGTLKALADPLRLRMLSAIAADPRGESCVCDLADLAEVSQPTVSHHLKVLRTVGLLNSERRGTWVWYSIAPGKSAAVAALLEGFAPAAVAPSVEPETTADAELESMDEHIRRLAADLADATSQLPRETVTSIVRESYTALARSAKITRYLVPLTERFARQRLADLTRNRATAPPQVLFVCVANAGRSQLAAALTWPVRGQGHRPVRRLDPGDGHPPARARPRRRHRPRGRRRGVPQAAHRRRHSRCRCRGDHGLRRRLPHRPRSPVRRLGCRRPGTGIAGGTRRYTRRHRCTRQPAPRHLHHRMNERSTDMSDQTPSVLFVCVHNAGRSQMAAGWLRHLAADRIEVRSAGSMPAEQINPVAVEAMAEEGIDIIAEEPKVLTTEAVQDSDVVITMGCGDACPFFPGKRYEDWKLDDPAGQGIEAVRPIRDEIRSRIETLTSELLGQDPALA